jgi:hypothetical protein
LDTKSTSHCKYNINYHLVWCPKYRHKVLTGEIEAFLKNLINTTEPEDISLENLGFDIRSKDKQGNVRYIEVKARAESGGVSLTQNEWFKAKRFKEDYYLYAVLNVATKPELYIIKNPAEHLSPEEKFEAVRYIVSLEDIKDKGKKDNS